MRYPHSIPHLVDKQAYISARFLADIFTKVKDFSCESDAMSGHLDALFDGFDVIFTHGSWIPHDGDDCRMTRTVDR